jgi:hypothetical protein
VIESLLMTYLIYLVLWSYNKFLHHIYYRHWIFKMFKFCRDFCYCNYASWIWKLAWKYAYNVNRSWQWLAKCTVCINHSCRLFSSKIPFFLTNEVNKNLLVSLTTHWTSLTLFFVDKHQLHYLIHRNTNESGIVWNKKEESRYP